MARHQKIVVGLIIRDTPHRMGLCTFKGIPRVGTSRYSSIPYPDGLSVLSWNRPTCWYWTLSKYKKSKIGIHTWKVLLMIRGPQSIGHPNVSHTLSALLHEGHHHILHAVVLPPRQGWRHQMINVVDGFTDPNQPLPVFHAQCRILHILRFQPLSWCRSSWRIPDRWSIRMCP